jgi:hypothetical protein
MCIIVCVYEIFVFMYVHVCVVMEYVCLYFINVLCYA